MERIQGLCSCCFLVATFLSVFIVQTSQGQQQQAIQFATEPDVRYYAVKKHPANVTCEAYGAKRITFTCMGSQIPVSSQRTYETFDEARGQNLLRSSIQVSRSDVASVKEGSEFWCTCSAEDDNNIITSRQTVISQPFLKKKFKEEPQSQSAETGALVVFTCIPPIGDPTPEISWRKDRKKIDTDRDDNYVIGPDSTLTIITARVQDAGTYECIAKNKAGRRGSEAATLTIESETNKDDGDMYEQSTVATEDTAKPRNERDTVTPVFNEEPAENIYVTPTANVTLVCDVKGAQMMTFQCKNQRIDASKLQTSRDRMSDHIRSALNVTYAEVENFVNTNPDDNFKCGCIAWYLMDPNSKDSNWIRFPSRKSTIHLAFLETAFVEPPSDVTGQVGSDVKLTCTPPEGKPNPWVYWVFNQQRLDPRVNTRYSVDTDGSLTIKTLDYTDEGRYYCVAENSMGIRQSNIGYLTVSDEPVTPPTAPATTTTTDSIMYEPTFPAIIPESPVFTRDLNIDNYLDENGEVTLICTVVSADQLTFRCNNERRKEDAQVISIKTSRETSKRMLTATTVVTYDEVAMSQLDEYSCQCVAWFIVETQNWQYLVSNSAVIRAPFIDMAFEYEPQGDMFNIGDTAEFACQPPAGEPKPKVMWFKDGAKIDPSMDSNFVIPEEGVLIVEQVRAKDAGKYICVSTNSAGTRSSKPALLELYNAPPTTSGDVDMDGEGQDTSTHYDDSMEKMTTTTEPLDVITSVDYGRFTPFFTIMPDEKLYIIRGQPVTLKCVVVEASMLFFVCNDKRVSKDKDLDAFKTTDPVSGYTILNRTIIIGPKELEEYEGTEPYMCHCRAYYRDDEVEDWQYVAADNTTIYLAYLDEFFVQQPSSQNAVLGTKTELICRPPKGEPEPTVQWLKDGYNVVENNNIRVTKEGSLVFEKIRYSDSGVYICHAENAVKTLYSNEVSLTVTEEDAGKPDAEEDTDTEAEGENKGEVEPEHEGGVEPEGEGTAEDKGEAEGEAEGEVDGEVNGESEGTAEGEMTPKPGVPTFVTQPESMYYIIKSQSVTITCQATRAETITFNCNMESIPQSRVQFQDLQVDGEDDVMTASVEISREQVENYNDQRGGNDFYCQCFVRYSVPSMSEPQFLSSSKGYVQVAYLKKVFKHQPPTTVVVSEGEFVSLPCKAPEGNPSPEVYWKFNGERIDRDLTVPNNAFLIPQVSSLNAGSYKCIATNVANTRFVETEVKVKVDGTVVTGSAPEGGSEPEAEGETTPEYEDGLTGTTEKSNDCVQLLNSCGVFMPQTHADTESGCQNAPRYVTCVEEFVRKCRGMIQDSSIEAAEKFKMMIQEKCSSGKKGVCKELMECQHEYAQQTSTPDSSVVVLCTGIDRFLLCAEDAAKTCNIPQDNPQTSLKDLASWFQQYCMRVVDDAWAEDCSRVSECKVPIEQTTILENLVQTSLWCPHVHNMMRCTSEAVTSCGLDNTENDLLTLSNLASDTCPNAAEPEGEDDVDATDEKVIDGGNDIGQSVRENSAWSMRASMLLISLLPVAFVFMTCR